MKRIVLWSGTLFALLALFVGGLSGLFGVLVALGDPKGNGLWILWSVGVAVAVGGTGGRILHFLWTRIRPASIPEVIEILYTPEVRSRLESAEGHQGGAERDTADGPSPDAPDPAIKPPREDASRPAPDDPTGREDDSAGFWARWWGDGRSETEGTRCENCYSSVDPSASECPACGADLNTGWL